MAVVTRRTAGPKFQVAGFRWLRQSLPPSLRAQRSNPNLNRSAQTERHCERSEAISFFTVAPCLKQIASSAANVVSISHLPPGPPRNDGQNHSQLEMHYSTIQQFLLHLQLVHLESYLLLDFRLEFFARALTILLIRVVIHIIPKFDEKSQRII